MIILRGISKKRRLLSPSPQSPQKLSFRSRRADPVCRTEPRRSGKNWTSSDWTAAVSHNAPAPDPLRCGGKKMTNRGRLNSRDRGSKGARGGRNTHEIDTVSRKKDLSSWKVTENVFLIRHLNGSNMM